MHARLKQVDPQSADRINPNDPQRIQRALEVYEITGIPLSELQKRDGEQELPYHVIKLVRAPENRSILHARIERRFHQMLEQGFEQEVRKLLERPGMAPGLPSMRSVGYRQMAAYVLGEYSKDEMVERGIIATRQLAKRQFTWLRKEELVHWLDENGQPVSRQAIRGLAAAGIR